MDSDLKTVQLDRFALPPIPGPLPPSFFTDIPPDSAAIFSTLLGTRPFRPLPDPLPVHAVRSGNGIDIHTKSRCLFTRYPTIAETIVTPPKTWQDLYQYFDASDLWMEGAGFLFHVLGHIVMVNMTKLKLLEDFSREWAFLNEARLVNFDPHQDILNSLQTPYDNAWFDYDNLTFYDKEVLNSMLQLFCEAFQAKRLSALVVTQNELLPVAAEAQRVLPVMSLGEPVQVSMEARRTLPTIHSRAPVQILVEAQKAPLDISADPYQHFGRSDFKNPPGLSNKACQPMAPNWEPNGGQTQANSVPPYRNNNTSQSHGGQQGHFRENQHQVALKSGRGTVENRYISPDSYQRFTNDRRQSARGGLPYVPFQRQQSVPKDPVYVLDPQKSLVSLHKEAFGVQEGNYIGMSPLYSSRLPENASFQGRSPQDQREDMQYPNHTAIMSNDARFYEEGRFNSVAGGAQSMPREYAKHTARKISWPESDLNKVRTVHVTGFPAEAYSGYRLQKLFSDCGEIATVKVGDEKSYAFVTFKYPSSARAAINYFNGYSIEGGKSLTVQYSKGHPRYLSYGNNDAQQPTLRGQPPPGAHDISSVRLHGGYDRLDNQKIMGTVLPRNDGYCSSRPLLVLPSHVPPSHVLPSNPFDHAKDVAQTAFPALEVKYYESKLPSNLPAKPQYSFPSSTWNGSPSSVAKPQPNHAQGHTWTPEKRRHGSGSGLMSSHGHRESLDGSDQTGGRRPYGQENSKAQRKTPKKPKAPSNDRKILVSQDSTDETNSNSKGHTSISSTAKKESSNSASSPSAESKTSNLVCRITLSAHSIQSMADESAKSSYTSIDVAPQLQDFSGCSSECPKMGSSTSNSDARSNSISSTSSTGADLRIISGQPSGGTITTSAHTKPPASEITQVAAAELSTEVSAHATQLPMDRKEPENRSEVLQQQRKKKSKNKKKSPNQSSRSKVEIGVDNNFAQAPGKHLDFGVKDRSKAESRSHSKVNSNATSSSNTSTSMPAQFISAKPESAVSPNQRTSNISMSPGRNALNDSTPPEAPRRQSHRARKSIQSKSKDGNDMFEDIKPVLIKQKQDTKQLSQGKIDTSGCTTPSTGKSNSSKFGCQDCEETQTPTKKPQHRHRNNTNRKENKKPSPSPTEILSDPSNWPALGMTTKLQIDTKVGSIQKGPSKTKPVSEHPLPPVPIRRDSMASVVSQPPQSVRRLTVDGPNSPASAGSPLWPVVKRWDGHGRPPVENDDSAPLIGGNA